MNAKQEFLNATSKAKVICAIIASNEIYDEVSNEYLLTRKSILKKGYTQEEYDLFLESLDYNYDSGYGGQELFGTIWCEDGIWLDRGEYDGSEWWNINQYPAIPDDL